MADLKVEFKAEIRGKEKKTSKTGNEYIIVRAEDERGISNELCDRNLDNFDFYQRGKQAIFYLHITTGKYTNIAVDDVKILDM